MGILSPSSTTATTIPVTTKVQTGEGPTYQFIAGWILLIVLLTLASKTRVGYVIIYYSLLLMILTLLLIEYQQFTPLLNSITTIGQFNP